MDKKKINRKGCRKDRSFRERESGEGESLHKMAAEEQRALFVDGENEVKGAKVSPSSTDSESVGRVQVDVFLIRQGAREDDMENEIAEMDKFDLDDETAPTAKEKSSRVAGGSSKPKLAPNRKPPQNRNSPTTDGRTKPNPKPRQTPAVPRNNQGGTQTSSRGRGKFSSKGSRSGPSEDPNVASWRDHFAHGKVFQFSRQSSTANGEVDPSQSGQGAREDVMENEIAEMDTFDLDLSKVSLDGVIDS
nr:hypothetical protein Iba_chr07bCG4430 [Ipomoea batatas]